MNNLKLHCPSCKHESPLPPQPCPQCGAQMTLVTHRSSMSPIVVIILLFLVTGPFGLGMLWRNDRFTRNAKWALTILVFVYTVILLWAFYIALQWCMNQIDAAVNQIQL